MFEAASASSCSTWRASRRPRPTSSSSASSTMPARTGATQYEGDFWGLYLAVEQLDGQFLDEHDLPDGNLYKMEGGTGTLNNQGPTRRRPIGSDVSQFMSGYSSNADATTWWRTTSIWSATTLPLRHRRPSTTTTSATARTTSTTTIRRRSKWSILPWDLDLTWADNMYGGGGEPFQHRVRLLRCPSLQIEYQQPHARDSRSAVQHRADRQLIDEMAQVIDSPAGATVDRRRRSGDVGLQPDHELRLRQFEQGRTGPLLPGEFHEGLQRHGPAHEGLCHDRDHQEPQLVWLNRPEHDRLWRRMRPSRRRRRSSIRVPRGTPATP